MPGFLYQIENRLQKVKEERDRTRGERLITSLREAHIRAKKEYTGEKVKIIGIPVPATVHERIEAFLDKHKDDSTIPNSKKQLALACILKFLDEDALHNPTGLPSIGGDALLTEEAPSFDEPRKAY